MNRRDRKQQQKSDFKPVVILFAVVAILLVVTIVWGVKG